MPENLNPDFAKRVSENSVLRELPRPEVGQLWKHRNGFIYEIILVNVELAGKLRHENPCGNLFVYRCLSNGKAYARMIYCWDLEMQSFELVKPAKQKENG